MLLSDTTSGRGLFFHRPSPALLIEASCGCSHRLPTSFLAWIFPRVPNWLKVLLLTPKQILGGPREVVPVCSWTQGRTDKPRNKKHIRVYFGMLHLLVTNIVKPSAPGHSLARFWFFASWQVMLHHHNPLFPTLGDFCADTHHHPTSQGWTLGQHGKSAVPSPWQHLGGSRSCQGTSSTLHISRHILGHKASGTPMPGLLI